MLDERSDVVSDIGLKLEDVLLRKYMGNDLALAGVCITVSGVEQATGDGDKGVIKVGLQRATAVGVNDLERRGIGNREVVWCDTDERACAHCLDAPEATRFCRLTIFLVHLVDDF